MRPASLANDREISLIKGVKPRNFNIGGWECEQGFLLGSSED
jgi:hypothetical protein